MAKSAWKFLRTNYGEINLYTREFKLLIEERGRVKIGLVKNNFIVNNINFTLKCKGHLGQIIFNKQFSIFDINSKLGQFMKFTKPFNFRSKKKNIC